MTQPTSKRLVTEGRLDTLAAATVHNPASATAGALAATTGATLAADRLGHQQRPSRTLPESLVSWRSTSYAQVTPAKAGTWRAHQAGIGADIVFDPSVGRYAMVYGGDDSTESQFGITYSDDLDRWDSPDLYPNPIFGKNPTAGQPDSGGVTFPQLVWDKGLWYMFYIAFPNSGFEQGTSTICVATCPTLSQTKTDWTRRGLMLHPNNVPWIQSAFGSAGVLYRPNVVRNDDGTWGMFFNGGSYGTETIGYASAPSLLGPWTARSTAVLAAADAPNPTPDGLISDPEVFRIGDDWFMYAWIHYNSGPANGQGTTQGSIVLAHTTAANYPAGWQFYSSIVCAGMRPVYVNAPGTPRLFTWANSADGYIVRAPKRKVRSNGSFTILASQRPPTTVGSWARGTDTTRPLGLYQYNPSGALNDELTYTVDMGYGLWLPDLIAQKGTGGGIVSILIDDVGVGTIDTYAASTSQAVIQGAAIKVNTEGRHKLTLRVTSKNASSTGYQLNFSAITFSQSDDR